MLVDLRRMCTGPLVSTFPRYVESVHVEERSALVSTALPGAPMSVGYHQWLHTARRSRVAADFRRAGAWLTAFQTDTHLGDKPMTWPAETEDALRRRWDGHPCLDLALRRLQAARSHLDGRTAPTTAVHGDFWFGNLLVSGDAVTGVVDWENGGVTGCPLRDLARFPLSYSLYLDRHTRPGHRGARAPRPASGRLRRRGALRAPRQRLAARPGPRLPAGGPAAARPAARRSGTTSRWSASARWPRPRTTRSSGAAT